MQYTTKKQGFTLIEVVFAIGILTIFISGIVVFNRLIGDSQNTLTIASQSFNEATIGIDAMVKELRNAKHADNGAYPLALADDQEIIFYSNLDDDTDVERIRYYLDSTELKRGVVQPEGDPVTYPDASEQVSLVINNVQNLSNPIFYYYNGDWPADTTNNPLPAPARLADTKLIKVNLTINPKPSRPEAQFTVESFAQLRNLKTNL